MQFKVEGTTGIEQFSSRIVLLLVKENGRLGSRYESFIFAEHS